MYLDIVHPSAVDFRCLDTCLGTPAAGGLGELLLLELIGSYPWVLLLFLPPWSVLPYQPAQWALVSSGTTMNFWSFASALESGCFNGWKLYIKPFQNLNGHLKILYTCNWKILSLSSSFGWNFLLFVMNTLLILSSCKYQIWYVLCLLLVFKWLTIPWYWNSFEFHHSCHDGGIGHAKQVWGSLNQGRWKKIRIFTISVVMGPDFPVL